MHIGFSEDHAAWRDAVDDFCERTVRPHLATMDLDRPPTKEEWAAFRLALHGKGIVDEYPTDVDGQPDLLAFGILLESMARVSSFGASYVSDRVYVPRFLGQLLGPDQRERYGHHTTGESNIAVCISEPDAGSDTLGMTTTAKRRPDGTWVINGRKSWISRGSRADVALIYARILDDGTAGRFALFVADVGEGFHASPVRTLGLAAQDLCDVFLDDLVVPDEARIAGEGRRKIFEAIGPGRASQALIATGFAQAALDLALPYAKERHQFGRPIGGFQLVQGLIADMAMGVTSSRLMAYNAMNALLTLGPDGSRAAVSMAKAYCTEAAVRVASLGMEVQGAMGITREAGAERLFRDARMLIVPDGTAQIQRLIIGRELTGIDAVN
ncbi:MAG: hypothetical protein JWN67_3259 [Actinomycetia bacterium]|nr:hypothetical protein [Actinomycetes bacterium]